MCFLGVGEERSMRSTRARNTFFFLTNLIFDDDDDDDFFCENPLGGRCRRRFPVALPKRDS